MTTLNRPQAIIEFCLAPLNLDTSADTVKEVHRRLEHVIKTFQSTAAKPVAVNFADMAPLVINEAAHGYE